MPPPPPRDRPGVTPALRRRGFATPTGVAPAPAVVVLAADAGGEANPPAVLAGVAPKVGPGEAKEKLTPLVAVLVAAAAAVGVWTGPGVVAGAGAAAAAVDVPVVPKLNPPPVPVAAAVEPAAGVGEAKLKPDIVSWRRLLSQSGVAGVSRHDEKSNNGAGDIAQKSMVAVAGR